MISRRLLVLVPFVLGLSLAAVAARKGDDPARLVLNEKFGAIPESETNLTEVPFAPGATAVVLFSGQQQDYSEPVTGVANTRSIYHRRIKILSDAAVEDYGDFQASFDAETEVVKVLARTILPDGTEIDGADGIHQDRGETGDKIVAIAFPRVQTGAILESMIVTSIEGFYTTQFTLQQRIPVLESRFVFNPPRTLRFSTSQIGLTDEQTTPASGRTARGQVHVWQFEDVAPIPAEPNQPPFHDLASSLFIVPVAARGPGYHYEFATEWSTWNENQFERWNEWLAAGAVETRKFARAAVEGLEQPLQKAEALARALRDRSRVLYASDAPSKHSPDAFLASGSGNSADMAGTYVAMLRAVDVDAVPAPFRRRDDGVIPEGFPLDILLNDMLVRIGSGDAAVFASPASELPVGELPAYAGGVLAMPIDKKSKAPVRLPDYTADQDRATRSATVAVDPSGALVATGEFVYEGARAARWRSRLRNLSDDERRAIVQDRVRRFVPGASVEGLEIEHLNDGGDDLVLRFDVRAEGYAAAAGRRLVVNPHLFARWPAEDWSAERRATPLDLGGPFESVDRITFAFPGGPEDLTLPERVDFTMPQVGFYRTSYAMKDGELTIERHMRLDRHVFAAEHYGALRRWFGDIAANDAKPLVVNVP